MDFSIDRRVPRVERDPAGFLNLFEKSKLKGGIHAGVLGYEPVGKSARRRRRPFLSSKRKAALARKIRRSLVRLGYHVAATAKSATEALVAVEAYRPNVIVMDLGLGKNDDEIDTARAIQAGYATPIVFLTEGSADAALTRAQPCGFVVKPYQDLELRAAVEVALACHGLEQELDRQRSFFAGILGGMSDAVCFRRRPWKLSSSPTMRGARRSASSPRSRAPRPPLPDTASTWRTGRRPARPRTSRSRAL